MRAALVVTGVLIIGWGGWLLWPHLTPAASVAGWLLAGPVLHDLLLAPAVGLLGVIVATTVPPRWRAPVAAGLVVSGVLVLLALPGLLRPSAGPPNPGLADRDYPLGLAAALAVTWLLVLAAGTLRPRLSHGRHDSRPSHGRPG
jgi:hypothetical protein